MDVRTLRRCLRQLADAGCDELFLDSLTAEQALALARAAGGVRDAGAGDAPARARKVDPAAASAAAPVRDRPAVPAASRDAFAGASGGIAARLSAAAGLAGTPVAGPAGHAAGGIVSVPRPSATPPDVGRIAAAGSERPPALAADAAGCVHCPLHGTRTNVVFGEGPDSAELLVVGEAPGQEEDRTGRPFVGRAGDLLDLLLMSVGFPRSDVYICHVLKCRPPQNRDPLGAQVATCTGNFLLQQVEAVAPRVVVAVGEFAAQSLLQTDASIGILRGRVHDYRGTPLVVTYHPAFLLRSPHMCRVAWHDLQLVRRVIDEQS
jgi:uracil-DNA glycosylase